ncbi:MAG: ATP-dependent DNA helicase PcrA [Alphaproteobacteria bacterium MarineAlpha3_Bin5]|nr:DNA helicase II [Magnetovibrio sp.]PPR80131.1 MAG: ATP-dependent DNA helicase PcrA [Alphaproteobacteria bacterium MarineAlpha3_Bin5]
MRDQLKASQPNIAPQKLLSDNKELCYLKNLNDAQQAAVEATEGPVLVLAGAGTGKTRVLTTRLAHTLMLNLANPSQLLAVTFTNKAAREMKNRVSSILNKSLEGWWLGTFHSIGARILRRHAEALGLSSTFTILDTDDQVRLIKQFTDIHEIDEKRVSPKIIAGVLQRWKDRGITPEKIPNAEKKHNLEGKIARLYSDYQSRLKLINAVDFGDLILHCLTLFSKYPEIAELYQKRFRYIMVDEYQDTNIAQYLWLRILAQSHQNICCVGDDDQSIYSWRGAEVENILRFEQDFPGATIIRLEKNYRSTPHILAAASGLIQHNSDRLGKTLWTDADKGTKVKVFGYWDGEHEAYGIGDKVAQLKNEGKSFNDIAILVRASFQTREFEERFITQAIPYRVIGGPRFYERQEIRDAIAFLRVVAQPDDDLAFERIVNLPKRGIGKRTMQTLHFYAREKNLSLTNAISELLETDEFRPTARAAFSNLFLDLNRWRNFQDSMPPSKLTGVVLDESGYIDMWKLKDHPDISGRLDNLKELVTALEEFQSLSEFLEHVSLIMDNDDNINVDKVNLMTLHGAKGLEFDNVFLPGWEEGLFPHQRALDERGVRALEEERRLAYVGLTRAKHNAFICFSANRRIYGQWQSTLPSRFISELPIENIEWHSDAGVYGNNFPRMEKKNMLADDSYIHNRKNFLMASNRSNSGKKSKMASDNTNKSPMKLGDRVFHQKFGYGSIAEIDGDKLRVDFEKAGVKRVKKAFVEAL